jgi:hypothetical protein
MHAGKRRRVRCIQGVGARYEGELPLGRLGHGWMDNIKMDVKEIGWVGVN